MPEIEIQTFEELLKKFSDHYLFVLSSGASVLDGIKCDKVEIREAGAYSKIRTELVLHDPSNSRLAKKHNESLKETNMTQPKKANVKFVVTKKEKPVKKAERMPFKNETITEYLQQKDFQGLEDHFIRISDSENYSEWKLFLQESGENHEILHAYQLFLNQHLGNILKQCKRASGWGIGGERNICACWAPSFLEDVDLKFPVSAIPNMELEDLLDDYYNCLYSPRIRKNRFTEDPMEAFRNNVKSKIQTIERQVHISIGSEHRIFEPRSEGENSAVQELTDCWGVSAVKAWWRGLDEEGVRDLRESDWGSSLYSQLVAKFGGGLVEDWVKEWGGTPEDIDPDGDGRAPMNGE